MLRTASALEMIKMSIKSTIQNHEMNDVEFGNKFLTSQIEKLAKENQELKRQLAATKTVKHTKKKSQEEIKIRK